MNKDVLRFWLVCRKTSHGIWGSTWAISERRYLKGYFNCFLCLAWESYVWKSEFWASLWIWPTEFKCWSFLLDVLHVLRSGCSLKREWKHRCVHALNDFCTMKPLPAWSSGHCLTWCVLLLGCQLSLAIISWIFPDQSFP